MFTYVKTHAPFLIIRPTVIEAITYHRSSLRHACTQAGNVIGISILNFNEHSRFKQAFWVSDVNRSARNLADV